MTEDELLVRAQELLHRGVRGKDKDVIEAVLKTYITERWRDRLRAMWKEETEQLNRIIHGSKQ